MASKKPAFVLPSTPTMQRTAELQERVGPTRFKDGCRLVEPFDQRVANR